MPDRHIPIVAARARGGLFVTVTLYDLPVVHLDDLVSAFEERGPWALNTALDALREGIDQEIAHGAGSSEGEMDDLVAQKTQAVGAALWLLKNFNHGHIDWPPESGWIVAEDGDGAVILRPITDDFLNMCSRYGMN